MTNTQKATLRRIAREIEALKVQADNVLTELDGYASDNQDTLDGTTRGEKIDAEIDLLFGLDETFTMLKDEVLACTKVEP